MIVPSASGAQRAQWIQGESGDAAAEDCPVIVSTAFSDNRSACQLGGILLRWHEALQLLVEVLDDDDLLEGGMDPSKPIDGRR